MVPDDTRKAPVRAASASPAQAQPPTVAAPHRPGHQHPPAAAAAAKSATTAAAAATTAAAAEAAPGAGGRHPGLDGLRGVAVALVVAFHLWPGAVRGGWLGVGLLFTLSGYLIVGLIDAEIRACGRLRLGRFMERRARRLLPAALVTIAAATALTAVLHGPRLRAVGLDAVAAVLNVFNWRLAQAPGGYAAIFDVGPGPLDHFWSLAVEEQFYLLLPALALTRRPVPTQPLLPDPRDPDPRTRTLSSRRLPHQTRRANKAGCARTRLATEGARPAAEVPSPLRRSRGPL